MDLLAIQLLLILITAAVMAFAGYKIIAWMLDGTIDGFTGMIAIFMILVTFIILATLRSPVITTIVSAAVIALIVVFPFAETQLATNELEQYNTDKIEQLYETIATKPDNTASYMALTELLYTKGYRGEAIEIRQSVLSGLSDNRENDNMRSIGELFLAEEKQLQKWKRYATQEDYRGQTCPDCKTQVKPGTINCSQCGGPYLLRLVSKGTLDSSAIYRRLILTWVLVAMIVPGVGAAMIFLPSPINHICLVVGVLFIGLILYRLFHSGKDKSGAATNWD